MPYFDAHTGAWTEAEAAHLARRAGFGAPPEMITSLVALGMDAAVNSLVDYPPVDAALEARLASLPDDTTVDLGQVKAPFGLSQLQGWWIYRMRHTTQPLQEQFTLFLHNTLVSEYPKVSGGVSSEVALGNDGSITGQRCSTGILPPDPNRRTAIITRLVRDQNQLFRTAGHLGYGAMLLAITRDPAMLFYLDNYQNRSGRAQENYAREIMELFSMGVGNYSEADVREIARAFTGETVDRDCLNNWPHTYTFNAAWHDTASKTVFGDTFNFPGPGEDTNHVIDLILHRVSGATISPAHATLPATSIYIAWKLICWFVNETIHIDHPAVAELAAIFYQNQPNGYRYDVRETLRILFKSQFFYDAAWRFSMVKHPADFIIMALRNLGLEEVAYATTTTTSAVRRWMTDMGMNLFSPPNVAGWEQGRAWINSVALINRFNYANRLSGTTIMTDAYCDALIPASIPSATDHDGMIEYFRARLIQEALRDTDWEALRAFLTGVEALNISAESKLRRKLRGLVHVMMCMPQYQLK